MNGKLSKIRSLISEIMISVQTKKPSPSNNPSGPSYNNQIITECIIND